MASGSGFVAYPSSPPMIPAIIADAVQRVNSYGGRKYSTWEENDIAGRPLTAPIFEGLKNAEILVADISSLNFNVTFEIGYAIGIGKRVQITKSREISSAVNSIANRVGIFDTLGYDQYATSEQLARLMTGIKDCKPIDTTSALNRTSPIYILETPIRGHVITNIVSRVKKARLFFRSFLPAEEPRLSASDAISHVSSSFGVIVPLLSPNTEDADIHNLRAAFVAGLSLGLEKETLILQPKDGPLAPLDVRDFVKTWSHPQDIADHIHDFSLRVVERMQEVESGELQLGNKLSTLFMGDPTAENEFQSLSNYYLVTDEFGRASRGEVNLVVGRKGTGKTALFSQLRNMKRSNVQNVVVDLKPEGYQLIKLKEEVLDLLSEGAKNHLIIAFWEYLLYLELAYKLLEKDADRHLRDHTLYDLYNQLKTEYQRPGIREGDFSERLLALSDSLSQDFKKIYGNDVDTRLTSDQVTALLHSKDLRSLRARIVEYLKHKGEAWLLFDNLDKGWSTHGLSQGDIVILRCLLDASKKIQRELSREQIDFTAVVFIRNDVYQILVEESSDFGKESRANLDWSDEELLRNMLARRLAGAWEGEPPSFSTMWNTVCVSHYKGEETSQLLVDRSLMRPRYLLKLFNMCKGFAVNLQHERIQEDDIEKGLKAFSFDLLNDADHELTDIEPTSEKLLYQFIGEASTYTLDDLSVILSIHGIPEGKETSVVDHLIYYGVLGVRYADNEIKYIHDVGYNMDLLRTRLSKNKAAVVLCLHPAFWPALEITA